MFDKIASGQWWDRALKPKTEDSLEIHLTAPSLVGRITEARERIDTWLATLSPPPSGMVQVLTMAKFKPLRYSLTLRKRMDRDEPRMILNRLTGDNPE